LPPAEARRQAILRIGGLDRTVPISRRCVPDALRAGADRSR
jgi:hypothetical protein